MKLRWVGVLVATLVLLYSSGDAFGQTVPEFLNVQGVLYNMDDTPVVDGAYDLYISLHTHETGGTKIFQQNFFDVAVSGGIFHVLLNISTSYFISYDELYMQVSVEGDPPLLPRQKVSTVAYAFKADFASEAAEASVALDLDCSGCVSKGELDFFAATGDPSGKAISALLAEDVACTTCISSSEVSFNYAASSTKGGSANSAVTALDLSCSQPTGCVQSGEITNGAVTSDKTNFNWALGVAKGGDAAGVTCTKCIQEGELDFPVAYGNGSGAAIGLACAGCVDKAELSFDVADGDGTGKALTAVTADSASVAYGVSCTGCVSSTNIANGTIVPADVSSTFYYAASTSKGGPAVDLACTGCVNSTDIANGSVSSADILNGTITATDIANGTITFAKVNATEFHNKFVRKDTTSTQSMLASLNINKSGTDAYLSFNNNAAIGLLPGYDVGTQEWLYINTSPGTESAAFDGTRFNGPVWLKSGALKFGTNSTLTPSGDIDKNSPIKFSNGTSTQGLQGRYLTVSSEAWSHDDFANPYDGAFENITLNGAVDHVDPSGKIFAENGFYTLDGCFINQNAHVVFSGGAVDTDYSSSCDTQKSTGCYPHNVAWQAQIDNLKVYNKLRVKKCRICLYWADDYTLSTGDASCEEGYKARCAATLLSSKSVACVQLSDGEWSNWMKLGASGGGDDALSLEYRCDGGPTGAWSWSGSINGPGL